VRISARGLEAEALVAEAQAIVQKSIGQYIFGSGQERLETVVVRLLTETGQSLALAESCTGGFISHRITNVPGASVVFLGGLTTYTNASKVSFLGVNPVTLATDGAVSERTAREMAEGARARCSASFGLGVTGIAGPSGGSADKPVGTVYIALAGPKGTTAVNHLNAYDRETFKFVTSQQALDLLRRTLLA
jgi:nicotinamide-nucleotide amidase